jgi:dTMP kinase
MFISFEGLDGCGKTTQINLLAEKLKSLSYDVVFVREPGGTVISERIREILLDTKHHGMNQIAELLLFSAARAQLVNEIIKPALAQSKIVLCDRYVDSTTAYQGYGRGLRLGAVKTINTVATLGVMPHLTFIIDLSLEQLEERKKRSGSDADRMELSGRLFYENVRHGYLEMAQAEPLRFKVLDGAQEIASIQDQIWSFVSDHLPHQ